FSAALRFQQQRSEIMNRVSQFVNNFFTASLRLRGSTSRPAARYRLLRIANLASLLPRRVSVSAKEA
ncbi:MULTISPECIES: hypothetical protein, partial [unclassified Burkholderia]|uniref:hypothetical protein n=1 Tax=unclassified Burkholderia TaxID=2613784 RepID=UPI0019634A22